MYKIWYFMQQVVFSNSNELYTLHVNVRRRAAVRVPPIKVLARITPPLVHFTGHVQLALQRVGESVRLNETHYGRRHRFYLYKYTLSFSPHPFR
jgi:hypothetical protein